MYRDSVEQDASQSEALRICADLANRIKHLRLDNKRHDADVSKRNLTIHVGPPGKGSHEYDFTILLNDGRELDAIAVASDAMREWSRLLNEYGISIGSQP